DERVFWQNDFDNRINGLGLQGGPHKYEIRRGKTVPLPTAIQQHDRQLSPPHDLDEPGAPHTQRPPPRNPLRVNPYNWRPTSSVYLDDEDHHNARNAPSKAKFKTRDMYRRPTGLSISPPSSPEPGTRPSGTYPGDISPVDDEADVSQQQLLHGSQPISPPRQGPQSLIPTARRERGVEKKQAVSQLKESRSRDRLRDPQTEAIHPWAAGSGTDEASLANRQIFGTTTSVTGPQVHRSGNPGPTLGQRMRQFTRGKAESIENRPPWKGASGRAPMVEPVRDDLDAAPLSIQRKPTKYERRPDSASPETTSAAVATVRRLMPSRSNQKLKESSKTPSPEPFSQGHASNAYPSPPYNDSPINTQSQAPIPPPHAARSAALPLRQFPDPDKAIRRKPSPSTFAPAHIPQNSTSSSKYSVYTDQSVATYAPPHLSAASPISLFSPTDPWVQPPSRFSVTTCNTVVPDSPLLVDEDAPPLPTAPQQISSVMDRSRPVYGGERAQTPLSSDPIVISMKSSVAASPKPEADKSTMDISVSQSSVAKALPPVPPEKLSAGDRVAWLNARLESLAHRRININRSIKQMTELMPTDSLMSSTEVLRKREIEKQKVDGLKEELSEIQREEYDLGLKLYRANKRLEKESDFEGSSLWVTRATT
ncbi:hypothetical protein BGZ63DRAFT_329178, partial [Mariannaea sp. PMI_226]